MEGGRCKKVQDAKKNVKDVKGVRCKEECGRYNLEDVKRCKM